METVEQITRRVRAILTDAGAENPALDARLLVRRGADLTEADMISGGQAPLSPEVIEIIEKLIARRAAGEPVSRIAGEREFWGLNFNISPATLDPRPDTETLVEAVLAYCRKAGLSAPRILDLGTGSGCILIALLHELPEARGVGVDLNPGAVAAARGNAEALGVESRVVFYAGSWFSALPEGDSFDIVVSNPPYIPESEIESLAVEVRNHDPILALSGGESGLVAYESILTEMSAHLNSGGRAFFEIGKGQENDLARLVNKSKFVVCDSYPDLAGILRAVEISHGEN